MLFFLCVVIVGIYIYIQLVTRARYWKGKGIAHVPAWPLFGNMIKVIFGKKHIMNITVDLYNNFPDKRYVGYMQFTRRQLLLRDLDIIKQIAVKDFDHFTDPAPCGQIDTDPLLSKSLVGLTDEKWKQMRATLSAAFTSSKMRDMYPLILECAENLANHFKAGVDVEMKEVFSKYVNDVIASAAFGTKIDSFNEPNNEFFGKALSLTNFGASKWLKLLLMQISLPFLQIKIIPKRVIHFFRTIVEDNISKREAEGVVRPDLIQFLIDARKGTLKRHEGKKEENEGFATVEEVPVDPNVEGVELTNDQILAQAMFFFFNGFETVSTACCFMAHEIAVSPGVQKKLQEEIDTVNQKCDGKISYETLLSMKYFDQVVSESLRLWPPTFQIKRLCVKDYMIPPPNSEEKPFMVENGIVAVIPVMALHRDPQYFPEPERFDPERFSEENKAKIVPGTYLPFGLGPRNCIGSRFALLEIKALFFHLLLKFDIKPIKHTEIPVKVSPRSIKMGPKHGFWLGLKLRNA